jgi:hypothetical protein
LSPPKISTVASPEVYLAEKLERHLVEEPWFYVLERHLAEEPQMDWLAELEMNRVERLALAQADSE